MPSNASPAYIADQMLRRIEMISSPEDRGVTLIMALAKLKPKSSVDFNRRYLAHMGQGMTRPRAFKAALVETLTAIEQYRNKTGLGCMSCTSLKGGFDFLDDVLDTVDQVGGIAESGRHIFDTVVGNNRPRAPAPPTSQPIVIRQQAPVPAYVPPVAPVAKKSEVPWVPIAIGGSALLVVVAVLAKS
jgi:hypothetical protein